MRQALLLLVLSSALAQAAGRFIPFPKGPKVHRARLVQERKHFLPKGAVGPLKTLNLRYDEVDKGQSRTLIWYAESYRNPQGKLLFLVLGAEYSKGLPVYLVREFGPTFKTHRDVKNPRLTAAFKAWDKYVMTQNLARQLSP